MINFLVSFIMIYLILNFSFLLATSTLFEVKLILFFRARSRVSEFIPSHWFIKKVSFITISYSGGGVYEVYVEVHNRITHDWTNAFIKVNLKGDIIDFDKLENSIKFYDNRIPKSLIRDEKLKKLGI